MRLVLTLKKCASWFVVGTCLTSTLRFLIHLESTNFVNFARKWNKILVLINAEFRNSRFNSAVRITRRFLMKNRNSVAIHSYISYFVHMSGWEKMQLNLMDSIGSNFKKRNLFFNQKIISFFRSNSFFNIILRP